MLSNLQKNLIPTHKPTTAPFQTKFFKKISEKCKNFAIGKSSLYSSDDKLEVVLAPGCAWPGGYGHDSSNAT
jgi:peptide methionine sulfoxide reductase MsrB